MQIIAHHHGPIEIRETVTVDVRGQAVEVPANRVLNPGDDVSGEPEDVRQACSDWWTEARVEAFAQSKVESDV